MNRNNKVMKKLLLFAQLLCLFALPLQAQELNCQVRINTQKLQTVDPSVFETLQQTIQEFMNSTKWTNDVFDNTERIDCNILLTIQEELSPTRFKADLAIQATRPVFNSNYQTPLLNHIDRELSFTYEQYQPLRFSRNNFNDNLSAVLSFYTYVILGMDYDSYGLYGGEPYYQIANEILTSIPQAATATYSGWQSQDGNRNRFWIIENLLSPRIRPYREAMYNYHRYALDVMSDDAQSGRAVMSQSINVLQDVFQNYPNAMILQMFVNAKSDEVIEVFKRGTPDEKNTIIRVMSRIDASNAAQYRTIR